MVPCPENPDNKIPLEEDSYDFGDYVVSKVGKCKLSKFEISVKEGAVAAESYALSFINSCDVRPEDEDNIPNEDEDEYENPICKEINIMVLNQEDENDEMDQNWSLNLATYIRIILENCT